jgi:hypothetical protein
VSAVVCVLVRLPFVSRRLWDHDSVQFALGVEHYDLAAHHPHPAGYPLYIALLKVLAACGLEPVSAMVLVTLVASALGAACMPLLVRPLARGRGRGAERASASVFGTALFASALFVFNPLLWFYGELPLLYGVEGGLTWCSPGLRRGWSMGVGRWCARPCFWRSPAVCDRRASCCWRRSSPSGSGAPGGAVRCGERGSGWRSVSAAWRCSPGRSALPLRGRLPGLKAINDEHFKTLLPATSVLYGAGFGALRHNLLLLTKWAAQGLFPAGLALLALALAQVPPNAEVRGRCHPIGGAPSSPLPIGRVFSWLGPCRRSHSLLFSTSPRPDTPSCTSRPC